MFKLTDTLRPGVTPVVCEGQDVAEMLAPWFNVEQTESLLILQDHLRRGETHDADGWAHYLGVKVEKL